MALGVFMRKPVSKRARRPFSSLGRASKAEGFLMRLPRARDAGRIAGGTGAVRSDLFKVKGRHVGRPSISEKIFGRCSNTVWDLVFPFLVSVTPAVKIIQAPAG